LQIVESGPHCEPRLVGYSAANRAGTKGDNRASEIGDVVGRGRSARAYRVVRGGGAGHRARGAGRGRRAWTGDGARTRRPERWGRERTEPAVPQRHDHDERGRAGDLLGALVGQPSLRRRQAVRVDDVLRRDRRVVLHPYKHRVHGHERNGRNVGVTRTGRARPLVDTFEGSWNLRRPRRGGQEDPQPRRKRVLPGLHRHPAGIRQLLRLAQLGRDRKHAGAVRVFLQARRRLRLRSR
jgi:hypothetical protein